MILQSLVDYYEILAAAGKISKPGYCMANVSYALNISQNGELLGIIPLKIEVPRGKKMVEVPQSLEVPEKQRNSSDITPNFLCDDIIFTLGITKNGNEKQEERAIKAFSKFKNFHLKLLNGLSCNESKALCLFLQNWETQCNNLSNILEDNLKRIADKENIVFCLEGGGYIHENEHIKSRWDEYYKSLGCDVQGKCLVSGKDDYIVRVHPKFNVQGGTNPALISYDEESVSYCSYGKDGMQGQNAWVGKYAAFAYGAALKKLLSSKKNSIILSAKDNKRKLGNAEELYQDDIFGTTVVFGAKTAKPEYELLVKQLFDVNFDASEYIDTYRDDPKTTMYIQSVLLKAKSGKPVSALEDLDKNVQFFILGLSPAKGRLSVRFFWENTIETIVYRLAQHYNELEIERQNEWEKSAIPIPVILAQTIPKTSNNSSPSPLLEGAILRAVLAGTDYPISLYNSIIIRIKSENSLNYYKAAIIKAYLARKLKGQEKFKEVLTVSLNEGSENKAYLLGRLFAVLEKAQIDSRRNSEEVLSIPNKTVTDKFFSSACATPASIFPKLLKLSKYHMSKSEFGYVSEKRIQQILEKLNEDDSPYPTHLSLIDQGIFILGYYHQKKDIYRKKEN